jgi:UDP-N-acetylglucosamine 2-epimerase
MRYNPEEINRRVADSVADLLFPNTREAYEHLIREGYPENSVFEVGDIMLDSLLTASREHNIPIESGDYHVLTIHRAENTDDPERLRTIVQSVVELGEKVCFPVHPRTEKCLQEHGLMEKLQACETVEILPPMGFLEFLRLLAGCNKVITDSGGVRREGYMLGKPVITLIGIIWFPEIVKSGWLRVVDRLESPTMVAEQIRSHAPTGPRPPVFGDGTAAAKIVDIIAERYS